MKCPGCGEEIDYVSVISECVRRGNLKGNRITDYDRVERIYDILRIECPECLEVITGEIEYD